MGRKRNYMQRKSFIQNVTIIVLAVAIIAMSVGYATYATPVKITGTTTIERASWDIKFANVKKLGTTTIGDALITEPSISDSTNLTFGAKLGLNTKYEFTVDVVNEGTIPAELSTFTLAGTKGSETVLESSSGLTYSNDYLTYTVTYADGTQLKANDELGAGDTATLKVSVAYTQPEDSANLPQTASETYVFTLDMNYIQAE